MKILVAYSKNNRVIGNNGEIPWILKNERRRFKQICNGKKVIMGRKTFEEIGHALPYCTIVIISESMNEIPENCLLGKIVIEDNSFKVVLRDGTVLQDDLLIAGGEEIYKQALPFADTIYATEIDGEFEGNRHFPIIDENWKKVSEEPVSDDLLPYSYVTFIKTKALHSKTSF